MSITLITGKEKSGKTFSLLKKISTIRNVCNSDNYTLKFVHSKEFKKRNYSEKRYSQYNFIPVKNTEEMYEHIKEYKKEKNGSFAGKTHIFIDGLSHFGPAVIPLLRTLRLARVGVTATLDSYIEISEQDKTRRFPYPTAPALLAFADKIIYAFGDYTHTTEKPRLLSFVGPMGSEKTLDLIEALLKYKSSYGADNVLAVKHSLDIKRNNEATYIMNQNQALREIKYPAISLNNSHNLLDYIKEHPNLKIIGIDETNFFGWQVDSDKNNIELKDEEVKDKKLEEILNFYFDSYGKQINAFPRDYFVYEKKGGSWFFVKPDLFDVVNELYAQGKIIIASGLELSCFGEPFSPTHYLLAVSDEIFKHRAVCKYCEKVIDGEINFTGTVTQRLDSNGEPTSFKEPLIKVGAVGDSYFPVCWSHHQVRDKPHNLGFYMFEDLLR